MSNPVYFPQLASGTQVQRPYRVANDFNSVFKANPFARPYSFAKRGGGGALFSQTPLGAFDVSFPSISDSEVVTLSTFFDSMRGRLGEFVYLDPGGNLINNSEDFSQTSWTSQMTSVALTAAGITDPFGGTRATSLTATSSNSFMTPVVVPGGFLPAGYLLNVSVWVKATMSGQNFFIGFRNTGGNIGAQIFALPNGQWKRIDFTMAINSTDPIRAVFGGNFTWASGSPILFFGPQCVPLTGPGGYAKTPDYLGYRPTCRFDTDTFSFLAKAPNDNHVSLPVVEYYLS